MHRHRKVDWSDNEILKQFRPVSAEYVSGLDLIGFLNSYVSKTITKYDRNDFHKLILSLPHPSTSVSKLLFHDYHSSACHSAQEMTARSSLYSCLQKNNDLSIAFRMYVQNNFKKSALITQHDRSLRIIVGVLALICFRSIAKSPNGVKSCLKKKAKAIIKELYPDIDYNGEIPVASDAFLDALQLTCHKNAPEGREFFNFILGVYIKEKKKGANADVALINVLEKSVLQNIRLTGMTEIMLLEQVADIYKVGVPLVIEALYPQMSQIRINLFGDDVLRKYMSAREFYAKYMKNKDEFAWPWARTVDDGFFDGFYSRDNCYNCGRLASIVALTNPGILNMPCLKQVSILPYSDLAIKVHACFSKLPTLKPEFKHLLE